MRTTYHLAISKNLVSDVQWLVIIENIEPGWERCRVRR